MELPKLEKPESYVGLYVFDFGDHTGVGFTAQEVAELLESEKYCEGKVYKIHNAYPDGRFEIKGVPAQTFALEAGMFFYSNGEDTARQDYKNLIDLSVRTAPPCRAKVHFTKHDENSFVVAMIYPAEFDDEISTWLITGEYHTNGAVEGGVGAVQKYYDRQSEIMEKHQLFGESSVVSRTGEELLTSLKSAVQR